MGELGERVQERLTLLLDEAGTSRDKQYRRDVWTLYKNARPVWVNATLGAWQAALSSSTNPSLPPKTSPRIDELALVGAETVEHTIIASRLAREVREPFSHLLEELTLRIRSVEGGEQLQAQDILLPDVPLLLMVEQWSASGMALDHWTLIAELVLQHWTDRLKTAYTNCNEFLAEQGVAPLPELKDKIKRSPEAAHVAPRAASEPSRHGLSQSSDLTPISHAVKRPTQGAGILEQLKRLLTRHGGPGPGVGVGVGSGAVTHTGADAPQTSSPRLAAALAQAQQQARTVIFDDTVVETLSPDMMRRVTDRLREQTTQIKQKAETFYEKATIEVVALMFQSILAESRIAPAIRVWFARLQMPVLREALDDATFVGDPDHPARRLIDRMGSCVLGFHASDISARAMEAEIKRVVQVIEQYPETGRRAFGLMLQEFERFLTRFLVEKGSTGPLSTLAQQVELKETLTIQYTIELRNLLRDMPVRDSIRSFLFKVWAEVLAVATLRQGAQHAQTVALKKAAADLVWVVSAKGNRSERARVVQQLAQLLDQLRQGMSLLGLPATEQEAHIKMVSTTLGDALMSKTQAITQAQIDDLSQHLAQLEHLVSDESAGDLSITAQSIEMMLGIDASSIDVVLNGGAKPNADMVQGALALQPGAWFTLNHNDRVSQVQFSWRSDHKQFNLLASVDGHCYLIQTQCLAAYLQAGLLLPLEDETLTVRASRDALAKLEANPQRLLN